MLGKTFLRLANKNTMCFVKQNKKRLCKTTQIFCFPKNIWSQTFSTLEKGGAVVHLPFLVDGPLDHDHGTVQLLQEDAHHLVGDTTPAKGRRLEKSGWWAKNCIEMTCIMYQFFIQLSCISLEHIFFKYNGSDYHPVESNHPIKSLLLGFFTNSKWNIQRYVKFEKHVKRHLTLVSPEFRPKNNQRQKPVRPSNRL